MVSPEVPGGLYQGKALQNIEVQIMSGIGSMYIKRQRQSDGT
jgi:hypothetical protein